VAIADVPPRLRSHVDPKAFTGLLVRVWERHRFRRNRFLGQATIRFNPELLIKRGEAINQTFELWKRGKKAAVSGSIRLHIHYGGQASGGGKKKSKGKGKKDDEDESDDEQHVEKKPLALSQHYHKFDPRLQNSTHVQVDEDDGDGEDEGGEENEDALSKLTRKGKSKLSKLSNEIKLATKTLEVSNSSSGSSLQAAKGVVGVKAGSWYFEVKVIAQGQRVQVGWCTSSYGSTAAAADDPKSDAWLFDASAGRTLRKDADVSSFGQRCGSNSVIGVAINISAKAGRLHPLCMRSASAAAVVPRWRCDHTTKRGGDAVLLLLLDCFR